MDRDFFSNQKKSERFIPDGENCAVKSHPGKPETNVLVSFDGVVSAQSRGLVKNQGVVCKRVMKRLPDACSLQAEGPHPQSSWESVTHHWNMVSVAWKV